MAETTTKTKPCGNASCGISTGIHEGLTFGRGHLDRHGFWEIPCAPCARAFEVKFPHSGPCWPLAEDVLTGSNTGGGA